MRAKFVERALETFGTGDTTERADILIRQPVEWFAILGIVEVLQVTRSVRALDDRRRAIVFANALNKRPTFARNRFGDEHVASARKIRRRLAECSARKQILIPKRGLAVDEADINPMLDVLVLHAVIQDQQVSVKLTNDMPARARAISINEHQNVRERARQHVWLVSRPGRIQQQPPAIMDDARLELSKPASPQPANEGQLLALVTSTENRHPPAAILQFASELLHDWGLASSA